jgi:hypothetical protein
LSACSGTDAAECCCHRDQGAVRRVPATSRLTVPWVHEAITLSTEECLVMEIWGINPEPIDKEDRPHGRRAIAVKTTAISACR